MKKIINKNLVFSFILGIILCGGIVYGVNNYQSNEVKYSPTDSSWSVSNVNEAINSLHSNVKKLETIKSIGDATAAQILRGKKAVVKGKTITGTMEDFTKWQGIWINGDNGTFHDNINYTWSNGTITNEMVGFKSNKSGYFTQDTTWIFGEKSWLAPQIKSGSKLLGVTGTYTSDATATSADILKGKTAYVNGSKITGTAQTDIYNMNNVLKFLSEVGFKSHSTMSTSTPVVLIPVGGSANVTTTSSAGYGDCRLGATAGAHKGSSWGNFYTEYGLGQTSFFSVAYEIGTTCAILNGTITGNSKGVGIASFGFRGTSNSYWEWGYYLVIVY